MNHRLEVMASPMTTTASQPVIRRLKALKAYATLIPIRLLPVEFLVSNARLIKLFSTTFDVGEVSVKRYRLSQKVVCGLMATVMIMPVLNADERLLPVRMDELVAAGFAGQQPAPLADDAEFLRRIWLDLAGRIPTSDDTRHFLDDTDPDKRSRMIEQLLAAPTYAQRMQELFHVVLMERRGDHEKWKQYLHNAFERNKPWDQMVREVLNPDPQDENRRGAAFFYAKRIEANGQNPIDHPGLTRDVGRLFLGADLQCAQCHDHLFIDDYKQRDFQGLYSVYLNLSAKNGPDIPAVTEKPMKKKLEFISVFDPTQNETGPRIPFGSEIPIPEQGKDAAPVSMLALLASELPTAQNALFRKNIANRLWFLMMGRGLVHPLDLHHSDNPPSHPELLDLLASEIVAHQYDIKWMLRQLALSQTYQRSSRYPIASANADSEAASVNVEQVRPQSYLLANEKRMMAEQLLHSTLRATGNFERLQQATVDGKPNAELTELTRRFVAAFANEPREPEDQINPSVKGALFSLNDDLVLQLLSRRSGNLIDRLLAMTSDELLADELYLSVFTRRPNNEERNELVAWLTKHNDRREKAIANWAWSMLTSMEFVVNH